MTFFERQPETPKPFPKTTNADLHAVLLDELEHRAAGRDWRGFLHRGRQLRDFVFAFVSRRRRAGRR